MISRTTHGPIEAAHRIGAAVAGPAAAAVDRDSRFPREAFEALRQERLLSAMVPEEYGGRGASLAEVAEVCQTLGSYCASAGMIYAMHQIQVACLLRHSLTTPFFREFIATLTGRELLLASATSELGIGGDVRTSLCAIEAEGGSFRVTKAAPVVSYGEDADAILLTARRCGDAAASDQVLVLLAKSDTTLTRTSGWDALGMRGTCSQGFTIVAQGCTEQILPVPFADISSLTMLPVSHILWSSLWLGIATDAVRRARACLRSEARKKPGTLPNGAFRFAEVVAELQSMRSLVHAGLADYSRALEDPETLSGISFAIKMNNLKVVASRQVCDIVTRALAVTGIAGYKTDSKYALGRHLRDAHGAALMIANDRILTANSAMLLVQKDD